MHAESNSKSIPHNRTVNGISVVYFFPLTVLLCGFDLELLCAVCTECQFLPLVHAACVLSALCPFDISYVANTWCRSCVMLVGESACFV